MRTEQLGYLIEVSQHNSISEASEKLHLTRTALSLSIKALEDELGITLLERMHHGVLLTQEGQQLVDGAQAFFELIASLKSPVSPSSTDNLAGRVQFYSCIWASELLLPKIVVDLQQKHPQIQLTPEVIRSEFAYQAMLDMPKDFALTDATFYSQKWISNTNSVPLKFISFFPMYLYAQVRPDLPIASHHTLSLKKLLKYPILLVQDQQDTSFFSELLKVLGITSQVIFVSNKATYDEMLRAGLGIGLTYFPNNKAALDCTSPPLKAIPISERESCQFGYLAAADRPLSALSKFFLQYLYNYMNSMWHLKPN